MKNFFQLSYCYTATSRYNNDCQPETKQIPSHINTKTSDIINKTARFRTLQVMRRIEKVSNTAQWCRPVVRTTNTNKRWQTCRWSCQSSRECVSTNSDDDPAHANKHERNRQPCVNKKNCEKYRIFFWLPFRTMCEHTMPAKRMVTNANHLQVGVDLHSMESSVITAENECERRRSGEFFTWIGNHWCWHWYCWIGYWWRRIKRMLIDQTCIFPQRSNR